jgi:hypothetical protein
MRIDASSSANLVENGRLVPTLQVYDLARKIYFVEVDFSGTLIQPGTRTSFCREAPFRMSLKPGLSPSACNPSNDPAYSGSKSVVQICGNPTKCQFLKTKNFSAVKIYNTA